MKQPGSRRITTAAVRSCVLAAALLLCPLAARPQEQAPAETTLSPALERDVADAVSASLDPDLHPRPRANRLAEVGRHRLERPIASGDNWEACPLYCPHYLPKLHPELNLDQMCREDYLNSSLLFQRGTENPFAIALQEFQTLTTSASERRERLALGLAYAYLNRHCADWPSDTVRALLTRRQYLTSQVAVDLLAPVALKLLPESLTAIAPQPGQEPVDVRVFTNASYDSTSSVEAMLRNAGARGLKAVAVADRDRIDGAQLARRVAERLKAEDKLPRDFVVIPGEVVETPTGQVLSLFTDDQLASGVTMDRTIGAIHAQGGLAYLLHPGELGGPERLERLPFDGYLIQPDMFEMFRTLSLLNDPRFADKPGLTASNSPFSATVGLPYIVVESAEVSEPALREAMRARKVSASGGLYLPWMTVASFPPAARFSSLLNRYFTIHRYAELHLAAQLGADSVSLSTSWDDEIRSMMGLTGMPGGIRTLVAGSSPLLHSPHLGFIAAEYSYFRIGYDRPTDTAFLQATIAW